MPSGNACMVLVQIFSSGKQKQSMPAFNGFISATRSISATKFTKDYFTPRDQSFTDFAVVRELLKRSEKATNEVGQQYIILNTSDLGGCMKTLAIVMESGGI